MNRALLILVVCFVTLNMSFDANAAKRPNVLIIMVDDLGYSDIGCYGGEIETPTLDDLAKRGMRFSQFYNTAKCHSSRVSLLTGQYCIAAGDVALKHAVTSAEVLAQNGYFTAMTGKWHLDREPTDFGFQRYFGHLSGACNFFYGDKTFRLNGQPFEVPKSGFYTTVADVEYGLKFLKQARQEKKPWYLYVAFNAPHAPLHALPEDYAKYKGRYEAGWDIVRQTRIEKQKKVGFLPDDLKPSPRPEHIPAWNSMEAWRQKYEANRMTTLAAMIDRVDQEIGRLVNDLRKNDELENTFILFVSDNGACPYDRRKPLLDVEPTNGDISLTDSTGWSWARNTPFRYYKQNQFEGGISTPGIVHWPAGLKTKPGCVIREPVHLIDVLPTLSEITSSKIPQSWPQRNLRPVSGVSLKPIFDGGALAKRPPIHFLFSTDRGLRDGDWKAVSFRRQEWELYNLANDRAETKNLASQKPELLKSMVQKWTEMTKNVLHAPPKTYSPTIPAKLPHKHPEWTNFSGSQPTRSARKARKTFGIRARKNTKMSFENDEIHLKFTGDDPGIAMDLRREKLPAGPYSLSFRLWGGTANEGEIFFTVDPKTTLPKGEKIRFDVNANDQWQNVTIKLPTDKRIFQLRIDVAEGDATAKIADLKLTDTQNKTIKSWPK